jgi:indole-3-glycerol phosphate synthase
MIDDCLPTRSLQSAIRKCHRKNAIIAELKPASPTHGRIRTIDDPADLASQFVGAGACSLSVLTEPAFFGGSPERLRDVRRAVDIPLLRKDFIIDERQVLETRALGADVILLMARILGDRLGLFVDSALAVGLEPLVEVQTEGEVEMALATNTALVGINNRDLATLKIDLGTTARLSPRLREAGLTVISMSGVASLADLRRLAPDCDALLIGSALMWSATPARTLEVLASS